MPPTPGIKLKSCHIELCRKSRDNQMEGEKVLRMGLTAHGHCHHATVQTSSSASAPVSVTVNLTHSSQQKRELQSRKASGHVCEETLLLINMGRLTPLWVVPIPGQVILGDVRKPDEPGSVSKSASRPAFTSCPDFPLGWP